MENDIHFISGLPRSGTTLLAAILKQNPALHAGMSGPTGAIFEAMQGAISGENEFSIFMDTKQKEAHLRAVFDVHYKGVGKDKTIFDSHRVWASKMPALKSFYPNSYVFCCVRNVAWVLDSLERLFAANVLDLSKIFGFERSNTVYSRIDGLSGGKGLVGFAYNAVKGAFFSEAADRLVLIRYETLTSDPAGTMKKMYELIGAKPFQHDFENLDFSAKEFDARSGTPGLHTIRPKVEAKERQTILPPDLFNRFNAQSFWDEPGANIRGVKIW